MTQEEEEQIRTLIIDAVAKAFDASNCACHLSPDAQSELSHLMGMVKDLGQDSYSSGIEALRENNRYFSNIRKNVNYLSRGIAWVILASGVGGALWVVAEGVKAAIRSVKGVP